MGLVQEMPMTGRFAGYRKTPMNEKPSAERVSVDDKRRDFLRNSVCAAYATPLITAPLVENASASTSTHGHCSPEWCANKGLSYPCCP